MSYDAHANLAITNVATAPSPPTTGTSLTVTTGAGSLFPATPFNCTIYPPSTIPTQSSAEIIRVTAVVGDVLTITRAQEGTTAKAIKAGWLIANTATAITFTDIEDSIIQFISAGTTKASASEVIFSNANGVSFGADGQTITASVAGAGAGSVSFSAGTESAALDSIVFSNSNGVSFGLDGSTITASVGAGGAAGSISAGTASVALGQVIFSNSNGISFGLNGSTVTASVAGGAGSVNFSGGTTSNNLASITFSNSNGISFGLDAGTMTASHNALTSQSNQAASASNGSFTFQTLGFSNANNVTFGTSAGSIITASVATIAAAPVNFSAGTTSNNIGSIVFSNSNGISFGLNGSTITASASGAGGGGATLMQWEPTPMNNGITWTRHIDATQGVIVFDPMPLPCAVSFNTLRMLYSASNVWGSSNYSLPGSASWYIDLGIYSRSVTNSDATNFSNSSIIVSHQTNRWTMVASLSQTSLSKSATFNWQTDSTGGANSLTWTSTGGQVQIPGLSGRMIMQIPFAASLSAGDYWIGKRYDITTIGNNPGGVWFSSVGILTWVSNTTNLSFIGDTGGTNGGNSLIMFGLGQYTATSAALPASLNFRDQIQNNPSSQQRRWYDLVA